MKAKKEYKVIPKLPPRLEPLRRLAFNIRFSWRTEIRDLFQRIDPRLWYESAHNPVLMLGQVSQERLDELDGDQGFTAQLQSVAREMERYLSRPRLGASAYYPGEPFQAAYFSAEFGLTSCLPIYSGGLGILSGDHLKSASDLNLPLVAVGLLYQEGYFSQYLSADGWQMETYPVNDFDNLPVRMVRDPQGRPLRVSVKFKDQPVHIYIRRADVGRIPLYLLDTNVPENPPDIRQTTAQLYGGDREMRLRQEIVLGIGGVRALKALGVEPTVIHMNEGHSAFTALERINIFMKEKGLSFDAAREVVQASTVFTTHTPVPAGNDVFDPELFRAYFEEYSKDLGINFKVLLGYGRVNPREESEPFGMTPLALRISAHTNGVSRLHGRVSRAMWRQVWAHYPVEDAPIDYITNGIHVSTWISREFSRLFDRYFGSNWEEDPDIERVWEQVDQLPTTELWQAHVRCREQLVGFTRRLLTAQLNQRGASASEVQEAMEFLDPDTLTIGFARRFATYKRATLLFRDPDRLERIVNDPERPVQIVISGKAHPQDNEGKEFIKTIIHLARHERFRRRIVFIEDYNINIAQTLLAGVDVWLNTPRRPLEACGTSGMKALANGALNLSVLDGWWDEGFHPDFGWAIGHGEVWADHNVQDDIESRDLLNTLEKQVVPLFYERGSDDIPRGWVRKMQDGLRSLVPIFNAHRMVQEYADRYYLPCSRRFNHLCRDNMAGAEELAVWRQKLMTGWREVVVEEVTSTDGQEVLVGDEIKVTARLGLGSLEPGDVTVEAYYGRLDQNGDFTERETSILELTDSTDGAYVFKGVISCTKTGRFGFTVRVTPSLLKLENRFVMGLVTWA
ncbi:MAG: alpha-glucan family phosphorylase [Thermodesulfobacteriota bacterium]|nr:alpha-glucan family phosphorylase [Thermodesulfobacteriota bacterium]